MDRTRLNEALKAVDVPDLERTGLIKSLYAIEERLGVFGLKLKDFIKFSYIFLGIMDKFRDESGFYISTSAIVELFIMLADVQIHPDSDATTLLLHIDDEGVYDETLDGYPTKQGFMLVDEDDNPTELAPEGYIEPLEKSLRYTKKWHGDPVNPLFLRVIRKYRGEEFHDTIKNFNIPKEGPASFSTEEIDRSVFGYVDVMINTPIKKTKDRPSWGDEHTTMLNFILQAGSERWLPLSGAMGRNNTELWFETLPVFLYLYRSKQI